MKLRNFTYMAANRGVFLMFNEVTENEPSLFTLFFTFYACNKLQYCLTSYPIVNNTQNWMVANDFSDIIQFLIIIRLPRARVMCDDIKRTHKQTRAFSYGVVRPENIHDTHSDTI